MRYLLALCGMIWAVAGWGQQIGQNTDFMFNYFHHNAAVAGTTKCPDIRLGYRTQWVGFEGQPQTAYASIHAAINGRKSITKSKHGIGGYVESDVTGPLSTTSLYLAYAYHFQFNRKWMVSAGLFAGFQQFRFNVNNVNVDDYTDPLLLSSSSTFIVPDLAPGIYLYDENWTFGLSVKQLLGNPITEIGSESFPETKGNTRLRRHVSLMASRQFGDEDGFHFTPAALLKFVGGSTPAIDLNVFANYKRVIGVGVSYRSGDAIAAMMRLHFLKIFTLGYAYDITTSRIRVASSNSHEITLGISICPSGSVQGRIPCAAYR